METDLKGRFLQWSPGHQKSANEIASIHLSHVEDYNVGILKIFRRTCIVLIYCLDWLDPRFVGVVNEELCDPRCLLTDKGLKLHRNSWQEVWILYKDFTASFPRKIIWFWKIISLTTFSQARPDQYDRQLRYTLFFIRNLPQGLVLKVPYL